MPYQHSQLLHRNTKGTSNQYHNATRGISEIIMTTYKVKANNGSKNALFIYCMYTVLMCSLQCIVINNITPGTRFNACYNSQYESLL